MRKVVKKLLIAHKHNDYRPHFVRLGSGIALVVVSIALFTATKPLGLWISKTNLGASVYPAVLTDMANTIRLQNGFGTLSVSPTLTKAAKLKAEDMATKGYFAHNTPEGYLPWHWFELADYQYIYAGENLAVDFSESADIQNAWMASPGHRANILNGHFTEIGIATAQGTFQGRQTVFVVEMFGSPKILPAVVKEIPKTKNQTSQVARAIESQKLTPPIQVLVPEVKGESIAPSQSPHSTWFNRLLTNPSDFMVGFLALLGLGPLISLISLFMVDIRYRDPKHIVYAIIILAVIGTCGYLEWIAVVRTIHIV